MNTCFLGELWWLNKTVPSRAMANIRHECHISLSLCSWLTSKKCLITFFHLMNMYLPTWHFYLDITCISNSTCSKELLFFSPKPAPSAAFPTLVNNDFTQQPRISEFSHFSLLPLIPSWSKPAPSLAWIVAVASLLVQWFPPLSLTIYLQQSSQVSQIVLLLCKALQWF